MCLYSVSLSGSLNGLSPLGTPFFLKLGSSGEDTGLALVRNGAATFKPSTEPRGPAIGGDGSLCCVLFSVSLCGRFCHATLA